MSMSIYTGHKHAILLHKTKARCRFPCTSENASVPRTTHQLKHMPALRRNPTASRQRIQGYPLAKQQLSRRPCNGRYCNLPGDCGIDERAFLKIPRHLAAALGKYLVEKWHAGKDTRALAVEGRGS